ncbi:MAG: hypothetical protein JWP26_408 [Devosia sp.]|uniref:hypothetical protein n=1 Tax=Devosia sp. TaxID=1871048 RepID=UPI002631C168|nr:hypothetical protein [Devosia sp.]MDB5535743.1 hypothetical protein [Devosia sp.]MDB5585438.1 hypothetical protein [Devosia sp.]
MQIDRRITNGLAWAGLFVVVAIPVADAVSRQLMGDKPQFAVAVAEVPGVEAPVPAPLSQRPHAPVIETAAIAPAQPAVVRPVVPAVAKPVAAANPVVDSFLSSGKALPSYITGGDDEPAQAVVAPAPAKPVIPAVTKPVVAPVETAVVAPAKPIVAPEAPVAIDPVEVAALTPVNVAPMPMPLSMRPTPVTRPLATAARNDDIVLPPEVVANNNARPAAVVDDLRDWESGPLSEFLARRQGQQKSSATVTSDRAFPDGYYDDSNAVRRPRRDVYLGPVQDDAVFFPFVN